MVAASMDHGPFTQLDQVPGVVAFHPAAAAGAPRDVAFRRQLDVETL